MRDVGKVRPPEIELGIELGRRRNAARASSVCPSLASASPPVVPHERMVRPDLDRWPEVGRGADRMLSRARNRDGWWELRQNLAGGNNWRRRGVIEDVTISRSVQLESARADHGAHGKRVGGDVQLPFAWSCR
jgi:hypothetical protein